MSKEKIYIFDTTLRDGEQAPGWGMNNEEKIAMARQLAKLGVDVIEAGFPISSQVLTKTVVIEAPNNSEASGQVTKSFPDQPSHGEN